MTSPALPELRPVTSRQLEWLTHQVRDWQADGLVDDTGASAILGRYREVRRLKLGTLLLYLGGAFVGVGLIWLVASNLDAVAPIARILLVAAIWLALVIAAHVLAERRDRRGLMAASPVLGTLRVGAAVAYGAVILQAAQSLQVPAYEPSLVGFWSAGVLLYAYAVRGVAPLAVGIVTGFVWFAWSIAMAVPSGLGVVLAFLVGASVLSGISVLHQRFGPPRFGIVWRDVSVLLLLIGSFIAALPYVTVERFEAGPGGADPRLVSGVCVAVLLAAAALALRRDASAFEPVVALGVTLAGTALVLWDPGAALGARTGSEDWAHAVVSVAAYVALAAWIAALGILRDRERLTWLALAALVVFTTVQSFAVFAPIVDGAWLFVILGLVLLGSGVAFDRGRRELEASLEGQDR